MRPPRLIANACSHIRATTPLRPLSEWSRPNARNGHAMRPELSNSDRQTQPIRHRLFSRGHEWVLLTASGHPSTVLTRCRPRSRVAASGPAKVARHSLERRRLLDLARASNTGATRPR